MAAREITPPYTVFNGTDGTPLEAGYVYIGIAGLNPEANPINVYLDAYLTIPVEQPIRTLAGYPMANGTPARLYVDFVDYSITIRDKNGSLVVTAQNAVVILSAGNVANVPSGNITSIDVQGAIDELDSAVTALDATTTALGVTSSQLSGKNVVINGGCEISQVNGASLITPATLSYPIDNMMIKLSAASKLQTQQVSNKLNSLGAVTSIEVSVLAKYTPAVGDIFGGMFPIEGVNFARFQYGTANAEAGSLQFKARASVAGTYSGSITNYALNRSYPFSFALLANTDTLVTIPNIPGDTGGTWIGATNAGAAYIIFDFGSGINSKSTANTWQSGAFYGVTDSVPLVDQVNGSTLTISDIQFEVGEVCTEYERKLYWQVLSECLRLARFVKIESGLCSGTSNFVGFCGLYPPMRATPSSITTTNPVNISTATRTSTQTAVGGSVNGTQTPEYISFNFSNFAATLLSNETGWATGSSHLFAEARL